MRGTIIFPGNLGGMNWSSGACVQRQIFVRNVNSLSMGTSEDLYPNAPIIDGTANLGGPIVTAAGLLFIASALDNYLRASTSTPELNSGRADCPRVGRQCS